MKSIGLAAAAALVLLVPACGNDDASPTGNSQITSTTAASSTSATALSGSTTTSAAATATTVAGVQLKNGTAKLQLSNAVTATVEAPLVPGSPTGAFRSRYSPPPGELCLTWKDAAKKISMEIHANPAGCAGSFTGSATTSEKLKVYVYTDQPSYVFVSTKGECQLSLEATGPALKGTVDCSNIPASGLFGSEKSGAVDVKATFTASP